MKKKYERAGKKFLNFMDWTALFNWFKNMAIKICFKMVDFSS